MRLKREREASIRPHFVFRGNNSSPPPYLLLSTSFSALRFRVSPSRFTDLWIRERERARVCYEFVVVGGRVRNYQASKLGLACQLPPLPSIHPIYPSFKRDPLYQVYFQIASGEKRGKGGGKGGKQKRRNREYLHSPTPFPLPIISLL